jgi:hypothetical protein
MYFGLGNGLCVGNNRATAIDARRCDSGGLNVGGSARERASLRAFTSSAGRSLRSESDTGLLLLYLITISLCFGLSMEEAAEETPLMVFCMEGGAATADAICAQLRVFDAFLG